jgi:replicative DNA helicase
MKKPVLSDLRESGSIEQDADLIMMLYREEYYDPENPEIKGQADLLIRKHRNGPVGDIKLKWQAQFGQFTEWQDGPSHGAGASSAGAPVFAAPGGKVKNFAPGIKN